MEQFINLKNTNITFELQHITKFLKFLTELIIIKNNKLYKSNLKVLLRSARLQTIALNGIQEENVIK